MEKINFEFDFSSKWFQTPGYLFCKVPDCVKEETEQLLQEVEEGKHEVDLQDIFKKKLPCLFYQN